MWNPQQNCSEQHHVRQAEANAEGGEHGGNGSGDNSDVKFVIVVKIN